MTFKKQMTALLMATPLQFAPALAHAQDSLSDLNARLSVATEERQKTMEIDRNLSNFIAEYSVLISNFENDAKAFAETKQILDTRLKSRSEGIHQISQLVSERLPAVLNPSSKSQDIDAIWNSFRRAQEQQNPCDDASTVDSHVRILNLAARLHAGNGALTRILSNLRLPPEHNSVLEAARKGVDQTAETIRQVDTLMEGLKGAMDMPKVCDLFRSFDVIAALASVAAEQNQAAAELDRINIGDFLAEIEDAAAVSQAVTTARRMLTSYEASLIKSLRLGHLNRTISITENYRAALSGITKSLLASSLVPASERAELTAKANQTRANMEQEIESTKIMFTEGRRSLLLTRGRNLYAAVSRISREAPSPASDGRKKELLDYCKSNLGMTPPGRYLVPATPTIEKESELDARFEKADQLLQALEGNNP